MVSSIKKLREMRVLLCFSVIESELLFLFVSGTFMVVNLFSLPKIHFQLVIVRINEDNFDPENDIYCFTILLFLFSLQAIRCFFHEAHGG